MNILTKQLVTLLIGILITSSALAEPRTVLVSIVKMRPYTSGDYYITVDSDQMTTGESCTTVYRVKQNDPGAKAVIATLLVVYSLGQKLQIEVPTNTGCTGFGTQIQSLFLQQS